MNPYLLQCALRDALTPVLAGIPLLAKARPAGHGGPQPPRKGDAPTPETLRPAEIYIGDVRPKQPGPEETVPFVCLQESGGHDADSMTIAEILIRCAVYSPEPEEAAHELSNLLHTVRHALIPMTQKPLAARCRLIADEKTACSTGKSPPSKTTPTPRATSSACGNTNPWKELCHEPVPPRRVY